MKRAILIAGPTASGKSAVAIALAERFDGVVVNADAMQVYADLAVLTARPGATETARVPHRLFGHVDAGDSYSVGRWLDEVRQELAAIATDGRIPIIAGGTGLYLKALTLGLADVPAIPAELRRRLRAEALATPPEHLHARLASLDPAMAERLRPSDPQRITRALEVILATGQSLLAFQKLRSTPVLSLDQVVGVCLDVPRITLNARIDDRFDAMMGAGALDEAAALASRELDPALPAMRAVGVPQLIAAVRAPETLAIAIAGAKQASRRYAKRQVTFARHQLPFMAPTSPDEAVSLIEARIASSRRQ